MSKSHIKSNLALHNRVCSLPESGMLFPFDDGLHGVTSKGEIIYPLDGAVATLRPNEGRFGGAVAVEEGTTNLVKNPFFENDWTSWAVQNATDGSTRTIKEVEGAYGGKVAVLDRPAGGGSIGIYDGCGGGLAEGDIVTVSFRARRTKGTSKVGVRWGGGKRHTVPISEEWGRYEITIPKDGNANIIFEVNSDDSTIELDATQVEAKPFATSFVDGSRGSGVLEYSADIINPNAGTISFWYKPNFPAELIQNQQTSPKLVQVGNYYANSSFVIWHYGSPGRLYVDIKGKEGSGWSAVLSTSGLSFDDYTLITVTWSDLVWKVYIDGSLKAERVSTYPLGDINGGMFYIGEKNVMYSQLFDELLILPYAATKEEIQSWYYSGAPLFNSADTYVML